MPRGGGEGRSPSKSAPSKEELRPSKLRSVQGTLRPSKSAPSKEELRPSKLSSVQGTLRPSKDAPSKEELRRRQLRPRNARRKQFQWT
eukprot:gene16370-biopygen3300